MSARFKMGHQQVCDTVHHAGSCRALKQATKQVQVEVEQCVQAFWQQLEMAN